MNTNMMSLLGDETARFIKAHNKEELEYHDRAWRRCNRVGRVILL
jgi:hypothetical protein